MDILNSYVHTYVKEEIKEEGIVRSLPPYLRFLSVCGQIDGQVVNSQSIAREASVPRSSVDVYFSIMTDTYLGHFLPSYRPNIKVREQVHPKFIGLILVLHGQLQDFYMIKLMVFGKDLHLRHSFIMSFEYIITLIIKTETFVTIIHRQVWKLIL